MRRTCQQYPVVLERWGETELIPLFLEQVVRLVRGHVAGQACAQRLGQGCLPGAVRSGDPDPHLRPPRSVETTAGDSTAARLRAPAERLLADPRTLATATRLRPRRSGGERALGRAAVVMRAAWPQGGMRRVRLGSQGSVVPGAGT
jgi:hypothetical protein